MYLEPRRIREASAFFPGIVGALFLRCATHTERRQKDWPAGTQTRWTIRAIRRTSRMLTWPSGGR